MTEENERFESNPEENREHVVHVENGKTTYERGFATTITHNVYLRYTLVGIVVLFALYFVLYGLTIRTLPGNPLYPLKVRVLEAVMPIFKFGVTADAEYQLTLMDRRVEELVTLHNENKLNADTFGAVYERMERHQRNLNEIIAEHEDAALSSTEALTFIGEYATYARAAEVVFEESGKSPDLEEQIEDLRRTALNYYEDKVDQFVVKSDSPTVKGFLDGELNRLSTMTDGREISRELDRDVDNALDEVRDSLNEVDAAGAIQAASDALRYVAVADLLQDLQVESGDAAPVEQVQSDATTESGTTTMTDGESMVE